MYITMTSRFEHYDALMSRIASNPEFGYPHVKQTFLSFSYDFMFDILICVLVRIKVSGTPCDVYHTEHESHYMK